MTIPLYTLLSLTELKINFYEVLAALFMIFVGKDDNDISKLNRIMARRDLFLKCLKALFEDFCKEDLPKRYRNMINVDNVIINPLEDNNKNRKFVNKIKLNSLKKKKNKLKNKRNRGRKRREIKRKEFELTKVVNNSRELSRAPLYLRETIYKDKIKNMENRRDKLHNDLIKLKSGRSQRRKMGLDAAYLKRQEARRLKQDDWNSRHFVEVQESDLKFFSEKKETVDAVVRRVEPVMMQHYGGSSSDEYDDYFGDGYSS